MKQGAGGVITPASVSLCCAALYFWMRNSITSMIAFWPSINCFTVL